MTDEQAAKIHAELNALQDKLKKEYGQVIMAACFTIVASDGRYVRQAAGSLNTPADNLRLQAAVHLQLAEEESREAASRPEIKPQ